MKDKHGAEGNSSQLKDNTCHSVQIAITAAYMNLCGKLKPAFKPSEQ